MKLEDGALRVFINTKGKNREDFSEEFLNFVEYIEKTTDETAERAAGCRIKKIHERVCRIRKSEKVGLRYMQRWEELAEAREDGVEEGEKNGDLKRLVSQVCKKMKKNKTLEEIAENLEEESSVIVPLYQAAEKFAPEYNPESVFEEIIRRQSGI